MATNTRFRTFDDAFAWLAARTNYETMATQRYDPRTYGLSRVHALLRAVGRPDRAFDVVQIVGSKGKGSTAACLASILRASGRRTGLYTSPHLVDPRERIVIDGRFAPDRLVVAALARLVPLALAAQARGEPATFFEIHTVAALLVFRAARCDAVVLEAGMGGRLDATTAADAKCVILTSVSLDHTRQLGRTVTAIAREKAMAARPGVPMVCGEVPGSPAHRTIAAVCRRIGAPLLANGDGFRIAWARSSNSVLDPAPTEFVLAVPGFEPARLQVPLAGIHQAENAALAAVAALTTRWNGRAVTREHVERGLRRVRIPARMQYLGRPPAGLVPPGSRLTTVEFRSERTGRPAFATLPSTVLDGAHNPASFGVLKDHLHDPFSRVKRAFVVVGMAADKDVAGSLRRLRGFARLVVATTSGHPRALSPVRLARIARSVGLDAIDRPNLVAALREAYRRAGPKDTVVVTGSLYLCGELLRLWRRGRGARLPPPSGPRGKRT